MDGIEHNNSLSFRRGGRVGRVGLTIAAIAIGLGVTHRAAADGIPTHGPIAPIAPTEPLDAPTASPAPASGRTRTIYRADIFCQALEPESVELEANAGDREAEIEAAIAVILKQWTGSDTGIAGYRITVRDRAATIDLRRDPDSARPWLAFSTCEQFALFGSLRETLTSEPSWNLDRVEFLSLGEPLGF